MHQKTKLGLEYREYIFKGGEETVEITPATATSPAVTETRDWCFKYTENNWLNPETFKKNGKNIVGTFSEYKQRASILEKYRVQCG